MTVVFGSEAAVNELDLEVPQGEVLAVLGPSGCGKSTLLRAVGGLQPLDGGTVRWAGEDLTAVPAHRRGFGLMFQDHALFIHRTVAENIGFGLRMQRLPRAARMKRVGEIPDLLDLDGFGDRTSGPSPAGRRSGWRWVGPWLLSHGC
jgi:thiamine transport system ATP-binding protein